MTANVQDGRELFGVSLEWWLAGRCDGKRRGMMPRLAAARGAVIPPLSVVAEVASVAAVVDYGRWCAVCPSCGNGEMIWLEGPYSIWCGQCANADLGGQHRPIVIPERAHEIMMALDLRARPQDRCWSAPTTVEEQLAWNAAHPELLIGGGT